MSVIAPKRRTRRVGESDVTVDARPFREWLERQNRDGWTTFLSDNQVRYIERILDKERTTELQAEGKDRVSPYYLDELFIAMDLPWMMNELYPD